jgi:hypothetical protein
MPVPAIAFAWWLVTLPMPTWSVASSGELVRARLAHSTHSEAREPAPVAPIEGEWPGERTVLKVVTPAIIRVAQSFLDLPMGDERFVALDGHRYVFVLERHYHPPGFVGAPTGWHKGVTVYELR